MRDSFAQVEALFNEVQPFFIMSGIKDKRCTMPTGDINSIDGQKYIDAFDWLSDVITSPEWFAVEKAWSLRTPQQWAEYDLYGFTGLQEQIILRNALNDFKLLWKDKPSSFFGKHIDEAKEEDYEDDGNATDERTEVRPEDGSDADHP